MSDPEDWRARHKRTFELCIHPQDRADKAEAEARRMRLAIGAVYFAAIWSPDRPCDDKALWTELRDAAGIAPGASTRALA